VILPSTYSWRFALVRSMRPDARAAGTAGGSSLYAADGIKASLTGASHPLD
jgi:hypothetical protein